MKRHIILVAMFGAMISAVGCYSGTALPGQEGGECRVSWPPCEGALTCIDGACGGGEANAGSPMLSVRFDLDKLAMNADGEDQIVARFWVMDERTGAPYQGEVGVWPLPVTAGTVAPQWIALDEEGKGVVGWTACHASEVTCPAKATLRIAAVETPLTTLATSSMVTIVGGGTATVDPGGGGGTGTGSFRTELSGDFASLSGHCDGAGAVIIDGELREGTTSTRGSTSGPVLDLESEDEEGNRLLLLSVETSDWSYGVRNYPIIGFSVSAEEQEQMDSWSRLWWPGGCAGEEGQVSLTWVDRQRDPGNVDLIVVGYGIAISVSCGARTIKGCINWVKP